MPLIAFYTGARLEELGVVQINDITEYETDKWQLIFKKGKTISSIRSIPIHQDIINSSFIN